MAHSSIETLEPRWAPARLVAGPLPSEFGADLPAYNAELPRLIQGLGTVELPEFDGLTTESLVVQLATGWRPDTDMIAFVVQEWAHRSSPPIYADLLEYISDDRRKEALDALLAAQGELGETTGSFSLLQRRGQ